MDEYCSILSSEPWRCTIRMCSLASRRIRRSWRRSPSDWATAGQGIDLEARRLNRGSLHDCLLPPGSHEPKPSRATAAAVRTAPRLFFMEGFLYSLERIFIKQI